ncbi:type II toxin-antitoxin system death-on-curing family toxin [Rhodoferax sp.]|uniref:type II toxin-antitoxin system death-on-curing family toxin n=1 Tax=Rhodoferax sp. TaxID=50421 RepID=UPI0025D901FC|nr:type II toxin-antitoxin system death-on-curing family toxin [Rhodoferax sp.]MCM2342333.1 type II toxin-antitoxin system death-on-curing family toxin [Rhodoferax sp.]
MNTNWRWISKPALVLLHHESLAEHGGAEGVRDDGLLDSALARPLNIVADSDPAASPDVATFAASYGVGLAKNHAFVDGNKRAAFLAVGLFLALNGWRLQCTQAEATFTMLAVAAGGVPEDAFADWLRAHTARRTP